MAYRVEVRGTFGGWRPAITGTLNQTGKSDAEASTVETYADAEKLYESALVEMDNDDERARASLRIVEVADPSPDDDSDAEREADYRMDQEG